jgi:hypothetical protein
MSGEPNSGKEPKTTITLTPAFEFRVGPSPFANPAGQIEEELPTFTGSEFLRGVLTFSLPTSALTKFKIALIPCTSSLVGALYTVHLMRRLKLDHETVVHLDLPTPWARHLDRLAESAPTAVTLARTATIVAGSYQRSAAAADDIPDAGLRNPIYYCDPLDPRRLALLELRCRQTSHATVHLFGSSTQTLQWTVHAFGALRSSLFPEELLLPQGLFPWMSGLLAEGPVLPGDAPLGRLLEAFERAPTAWHVVVATPEALRGLALALAHLPRENDTGGNDSEGKLSPFVLRRLRQTEQEIPGDLGLCRPSERCRLEYSSEPGFVVQHLVARLAEEKLDDEWKIVAGHALQTALESVKSRYADWTRSDVTPTQERDLFRFAHRLARDSGALRPSIFDLLLAAQSVIDSNFSFELLASCRAFPAGPIDAAIPELYIPLSELSSSVVSLGIERFETLQKRRFHGGKPKNLKKGTPAATTSHTPVDESKYTDTSWAQGDHPYSCSFPEEDIFMEDFAFRYRDETRERIRAREVVARELTATLGDGIDIRETVRNWHSETIMVREELTMGKADIGSIVFVFVERREEPEYQWVSYWLAEQHDKSDLMFFATPYADTIIGPGIAKSTFGGFAVIPLPNYLQNPWNHQFIQRLARTPSEALLISAAIATEHRTILYVAPEPPAPTLVSLLRRSGKSVVYVRLNELPPDKIRRLRTFHILAEAGVRQYAEKYIRKDQT